MSEPTLFEPTTGTLLEAAGEALRFPVHRVYCVGQNYAAHAREMGVVERQPPFFFSKPPDAPIQAASVAFPPETANLHYEVELVVALGRGGRAIAEGDALDCVYGYAVGVDLTRRDLQTEAKEKGRPWDVAKGFDQSAPLSVIRRAEDIGHPDRGCIELDVDGESRQSGDLSDMIWPVPAIIAQLSKFFVLCPGDLLFTGTPEGVGPLRRGARVECRIEGVASHQFRIGEPS